MKTVKIDFDDIIKAAKESPVVQMDNERAKRVIENGSQPCQKCEGTGNEFLFMYRECSACGGTGIKLLTESEN